MLKRKIIYIIAIVYLLIMIDNVMAKDDRSARLSGYFTRNLEFYERHEAVTPPNVIINDEDQPQEIEAEFIEASTTDEEIDDTIVNQEPLSESLLIKPLVNIPQWELNQMYKKIENKMAYFTFDDGPSALVTPHILDILKREGIKATFFILGKSAESNPELVKRIYEEGHMLANHTYTHNYANIYKAPENLIIELDRTEALIQEILGFDYSLRLMRFPGGSFGEKSVFKRAVNDFGYVYLDWNCLNGDSEGLDMTEERLMQRFISTAANHKVLVILMHDTDTKEINLTILPKMIDYLRNRGYEFDTLSEVVKGEY